MNFLNKETLIDAAALGGGVVAGRAVVGLASKKVAEITKQPEGSDTAKLIANALPIAGGIATLMLFKGNRIATGVANGMFASSAAYYVDYALQKALGADKYKGYIGEVMMNGVMMNGDGDGLSPESVLMGAAQDMPNYTSSSFDFDSADAGELNY
jgi:hypothetical protein